MFGHTVLCFQQISPAEYNQLCSFYNQGKNNGTDPNFFWISMKLSGVKLFFLRRSNRILIAPALRNPWYILEIEDWLKGRLKFGETFLLF